MAIAIRNRWRRQQLDPELRKDVTPKNIIMIGPTGVGKTEIARRLAQLVGAPFLKVEATKYTEVGYHGRDVESMIRDLTEIAVGMVRQEQRGLVETQAKERVTDRLLDLLLPQSTNWDPDNAEENERHQRTRDKMKARLDAGELEDRLVELNVEQKAVPVQIFSNLGMEQMDVDFQSMFEKIMPKQNQQRQVPVREARTDPAGAGDRGPDRPPGRHRKGRRAGREPGHHLRRRAGQDLRPALRATAPTYRARECSATCCRSSRAPRSTPAMARCGPTTSCSSRRGRSTCPSRPT